MARGKQTCKILKEIRRQIAEANGIEFATSECRYKGDCIGTCPKCEAEVRYLEQQLRARSLAGKAVTLAGISAGMILMSGCSGTSSPTPTSDTLQGDMELVIDEENIEEGELPMMEDADSTTEIDSCSINKEKNRGKSRKTSTPLNKDTAAITKGMDESRVEDDSHIFGMIETYAVFPGGEGKLLEWISQHIIYPQNAADAHITGRVVVQLQILEDGSIGDVRIVRSVCDDLDKEALRVVGTLPKFTPAKMDGKPIKCWYTLPIKFKLDDDDSRKTNLQDPASDEPTVPNVN